MADPRVTVAAQVAYEVKLQPGPYKFCIRGVEHVIDFNRDAVVIVRVICMNGSRMDETIVGVIGDSWEAGVAEFLRIRAFLNAGGVIGLHRDLID
jgi:hypothetical protein